MDYSIGLFLVAVILIFFIMTNSTPIEGFWVASSEYCEKAEIDNFVILFKECDVWGVCASYILLVRDGEVIINEPCVVKISRRLSLTESYKIKFADLDVEGFPDTLIMRFSKGKMMLFEDDVLYGEFFMDSESSYLLSI